MSCQKLVELQIPNNKIVKDAAYGDAETVVGIINSVMTKMSDQGVRSGQLCGVQFYTGLSGDEIRLTTNGYYEAFCFYQNNLSPQMNSSDIGIWLNTYNLVFMLNDALEGIAHSSRLSEKIKTQLLGEARFLRAFCYFYLTNYYGSVPLILTTDYKVNSALPRADQDKVFDQIIIDLKEAKELLSDQFLDGTLHQLTQEKLRPTKWAASALLARVYLYTGKWNLAERESDNLLSNTSPFKLDTLNGVFLKNSQEAIWQAQPTGSLGNTGNARAYALYEGFIPDYYLNERLVNSFEADDQRKQAWMKSIIVNNKRYWSVAKYKANKTIALTDPQTEYYMMLRLGEQYLIRAEARAEQENIEGALKDLNEIRKRAGLNDVTLSSKSEVLNAILQERRVELFVEWGDRWFDLRRMGKIDDVMKVVAPEKGGTWSNYKKYFPISNSDRLLNKNLDQTPGY